MKHEEAFKRRQAVRKARVAREASVGSGIRARDRAVRDAWTKGQLAVVEARAAGRAAVARAEGAAS